MLCSGVRNTTVAVPLGIQKYKLTGESNRVLGRGEGVACFGLTSHPVAVLWAAS